MPNLKFCDPKVLEMLATKAMDIMRKEHTTPLLKQLTVCDPALGAKFLQQIKLHYKLNSVPKMFMEKLQMLVSEQKVNWFK
jgi:hypothetical protein